MQEKAAGYRGYMSKVELIEAAQPLADKSFTVPDPGSRYTAWSSMGSLLRKGLVIKYSNPAKFVLTEKGQALGERLEEAEKGNNTSTINQQTINSQARSNSLSANDLGSSFSSKAAGTANHYISPGCQVFDTGDADLDAALNASLIANSQPDHNRSFNYNKDFEEDALNANLNKSLEVNSYASEAKTGAEDPYLEAALKASLETSLSQDTLQIKISTGACNRSVSQQQYDDYEFSVEDTDLEAAIKASLEPNSALASSPTKTLDIAALPKSHSTPVPETNIGIRPLPSLSPSIGDRSGSDDSEDDEEMKRAIAESLLSYSQELCTSQCTQSDPSEENKCEVVNQSPKITNKQLDQLKSIDNNESVLVISDDDDNEDKRVNTSLKKESTADSPSKFSKRLHEITPSPSPPSCPLPNLPYSPDIDATKKTTLKMPACLRSSSPKISTKMGLISKAFANKEPSFLKIGLDNKDLGGVVVIADDDDVENNNGLKTAPLNVAPILSMDSDDDLPDLDVPLFQRLLNKGNIQSDLLKDSATSKKHQANVVKPSDCDSIPVTDAMHSKNDRAVSIKETCKSSNEKLCKPSEPGSSVCHQPTSSVLPSENQIRNICIEKKSNQKVSTNPSHLTSADSSSVPSSSSSSELERFFATCTPDFTLQPGTFDIILCLDNREFYGSKSSCKTLLPDLMKNGVQCDLRLLHVGDLLWIARERLGPQIDRVQGRELVLNYIIERKRMDDLVSSLTDGRMKEQKFRLKHCGLSETIILIEEYGSVQNFSLSEERIKQSIVNSQIIDGFKVKRCANGRDAVSYLAIMTRFLQQNLCNKTLHAVPVEKMKLLKGHQNVHSREQYLAPFTAFNEAAVKHKDLKVTELFAKQLIQVPGVSAERAKAIINVYPTLSLLLDAYKKCNNAKDREKLLATVKYGKNERNLGIAISRMLHMLYTQESLS
ncbi:hypothetical protein RRG08_034295 [Elysia crispata]|uniref:Crossover junction endonuclease MUS81 n=1 Tax=Elysia crispata TaxID=231223 RepID=A0AAE1A2D7_9GAST|nr:hypothetical protein RRG08_034295 [Elysia crispata]